jgi:hypothetical protein
LRNKAKFILQKKRIQIHFIMTHITLNNAQTIAKSSWSISTGLGFAVASEQQLDLPGSDVIRHEDENCFGIYSNYGFKRDLS